MPYIGQEPVAGNFVLLDAITTSATATYALTKNSVAYSPESSRNMIVSLNGVTQAPEAAYTVSGSNITFSSALTASDVIDYILVLGDVLDIGRPSDGVVGTDQMNYPLGNFSSTGIDDNATSTAITIDSSQNVGIGTTTPTTKLHIEGITNGLVTSKVLNTNTGASARADFTVVSDSADISIIATSAAYTGVSGWADSGIISTSSGSSGGMLFNVQASAPYRFMQGATNERMRIDASGNLLVGKTNTGQVNDGAHLGTSGCFLTAASTVPLTLRRSAAGVVIQLSRNGVAEGTLTMNTGAAPTLASGSDIRLKENVTEHCPELENILSIKTRQWDWKDKEKGAGEGVVAQELETIYPDLVFEDNDGMLNVKDFGPMTTRLIKAMQEQQAMIEELKAEVAALKGA